MVQFQLTANSTSQVQAILLLVSASQVAEITGTQHHAWLILVFLVEMGFYHVYQAGLKLLTSGNLPALAFQSAGIAGMSYHARLQNSVFLVLFLQMFTEMRNTSKWYQNAAQPLSAEMCAHHTNTIQDQAPRINMGEKYLIDI